MAARRTRKFWSSAKLRIVGDKYLDQYFKTIKNSLNEDGIAAIQGITIKNELFDRYRTNEDFIQKYKEEHGDSNLENDFIQEQLIKDFEADEPVQKPKNKKKKKKTKK